MWHIRFNQSTLLFVVVIGAQSTATIPISHQNIDPSHIVLAETHPEFTHISQLREEYEFALTNGWDGQHAVAISAKCLSDVQDLLKEVPAIIHWPEVTPLVRGGLSLLWETDHVYVFLEVRNDGAAHLYYNIHGVKWEAVRPVADNDLRSRLQEAASQIPSRIFPYISGVARGNPISVSA
jgi:hypothetical protein